MNLYRRHWKWIVGLWIVSLLVWGVPRCFNSWQLEHRQAALLHAIEQRTPNAYASLVSTQYADDWNFTEDLITKAMDDVAAQFLTLKIGVKSRAWTHSEKEAQCVMEFAMSGKPLTPIGQIILTEAAQSKGSFTFVWRKGGWGAWTWKLVAVKNANFELPSGYEPGSLSQLR